MTGSERSAILGPLYFDASALGRLYIPSQHSRQMKTDLAGQVDFRVSDLGVSELASAVSGLRREGHVSSSNARNIYRRLLRDIADGVFDRVELSSKIHRATEHRLLETEGIELRAGDALHLGLALSSNCLCMVTWDRRLAEACRRAGLMVYPG